jgi:hypothetical protein
MSSVVVNVVSIVVVTVVVATVGGDTSEQITTMTSKKRGKNNVSEQLFWENSVINVNRCWGAASFWCGSGPGSRKTKPCGSGFDFYPLAYIYNAKFKNLYILMQLRLQQKHWSSSLRLRLCNTDVNVHKNTVSVLWYIKQFFF